LSDGPSLFDRNMAAFASVFPGLAHILRQIGTPVSKIVGTRETGDLNLDLGHTLLYGEDAESFAKAQIEEHDRAPIRFYLDPPTHTRGDVSHLQDELSIRLWEHCSTHALRARPKEASEEGGYLIVYGIGLGLHLETLFEKTDVIAFAVIEEHPEFLLQSFHLLDWGAIFLRMRDRHQEIRFFIESDPEILADKVHWYLREPAFGLLDGSFIFRHYSSMALDRAYQLFKEKLPLLPISNGFYEDEYVMLRNGTANLLKYDFDLLEERPRTEKNMPAFIVGSGPSLDAVIPLIREWQDRAVIFSGGTALKPLLEHGIRPDFHCELENTKPPADHLVGLHERFGDFAGITLIASTTVDPRLGALFEHRIFFFRDSVSTTPLWCPDRKGLFGTAPTCTNTALRMAQLFNLQEIYLFGVDLGTRDSTAHHSKDAIYNSDDQWLNDHQRDPNRIMKLEMPANFGGKAYTSVVFHWAQMMMEQTVAVLGRVKVYNCSDGIQVAGTIPKLPKSVRMTTPPGRKAILMERLRREFTPKSAGDMVPWGKLMGFQEAIDHYFRDLRGLVETAREDRLTLREFYRAVKPLLAENGPRPFAGVLRSVVIGSLMMFFQVANFFDRRAREEERPLLMEGYYDHLAEILRWMHVEITINLPQQFDAIPRRKPRFTLFG
jgi:hypothetical protein